MDAAISFYTEMLGFKVDIHPAATFAIISKDDFRLMLSRPGGSGGGGQVMADGEVPTPGGWNRIQIAVEDLPGTVTRLKNAGLGSAMKS